MSQKLAVQAHLGIGPVAGPRAVQNVEPVFLVDLGLQKIVGVKYQGEKDPWYTRHWNQKSSDTDDTESKQNSDGKHLSREEQMEVEQERIDTFWAVFVLVGGFYWFYRAEERYGRG